MKQGMNAPSKILSLLALALLAGPLAAGTAETPQAPVPPDARNATLPGLIREAEKGVFFIRVMDSGGKPMAMGTGFLVDRKGSVLTSLHVMRPMIPACWISICCRRRMASVRRCPWPSMRCANLTRQRR